MAKLAAWSIDGPQAEGSVPKRIGRSTVGLEKYLENWIVEDVSLIGDGLTLIGRQKRIDHGQFDLLAIDAQDRWVVIEIKAGVLYSDALTQALSYASSIARLGAGELHEWIKGGFSEFGDPKKLSERVRLLDSAEGEREIAILLVGAGIDPGLERMTAFLGRFNIPIGIVSFEVFELAGGPKLLLREVIEEAAETAPPGRKLRVETIRNWAVDEGVGEQFDRFVKIAQEAGLAVQPQKASVRIAPQANRTRLLMYTQPRNGKLYIRAWAEPFVEFFGPLKEHEVLDGLGDVVTGVNANDENLAQVEKFLTEKVRQPEPGASG